MVQFMTVPVLSGHRLQYMHGYAGQGRRRTVLLTTMFALWALFKLFSMTPHGTVNYGRGI